MLFDSKIVLYGQNVTASRRRETLLDFFCQAICNEQIDINSYTFQQSESTFSQKTVLSLSSLSSLKPIISATYLNLYSQVYICTFFRLRIAFQLPKIFNEFFLALVPVSFGKILNYFWKFWHANFVVSFWKLFRYVEELFT